jgi:hypothetical protein
LSAATRERKQILVATRDSGSTVYSEISKESLFA